MGAGGAAAAAAAAADAPLLLRADAGLPAPPTDLGRAQAAVVGRLLASRPALTTVRVVVGRPVGAPTPWRHANGLWVEDAGDGGGDDGGGGEGRGEGAPATAGDYRRWDFDGYSEWLVDSVNERLGHL